MKREPSIAEILQRQPPFDLDAERALIGALLVGRSKDRFTEVQTVVTGADFYDDANRRIFTAISLLHDDGQTRVDVTSLVSHLRACGEYEKIGGAPYLAKLSGEGIPPNVSRYAQTIATASRYRQVIEVATRAVADAYGQTEPPETIAANMRSVLDDLDADATATTTMTLYEAASEQLEMIDHPETHPAGRLLSSGIDCIDESYGGFRCGSLSVIAARPGRGKSALAKQICGAMDLRGHPSLFVSLEMEPREIAVRVIAERTEANGKFFEVDEKGNCPLTVQQRQRVRDSIEDCRLSVMHLSAPTGRGATMEAIAAHARLMKARVGIKVLAVDYLQLMSKSNSRQTDYEQVTANSKAFKQLARELDIAVLLLSQFNRQSESQHKPRKPRLSDLRDSGSIEQDADAVIALHRPDEQSSDFQLLVLKWRSDGPGEFNVRLIGEQTKFEPMPIEAHPNYQDDFREYAS